MLGNKCFTNKKEILSSASYSTIKLSKNESWTQETIMKRGNDILKFMAIRWNIELSEDSIIKLL